MARTNVDFGDAYNTHETQVYGYIRMRANQDADAQDIAQDTWEILQQKMPLYDPARGPFRPFALYWAHIMLVRYYSARGVRRKVEMLFSELRARYPDLEREEEIGEAVARLTGQHTASVEEEMLYAEEATMLAEAYDELLRLTFDGPSPPHQLLAFGLCKLLEWKPREVVAGYSDTPLRSLVEQFVTAYAQHVPLGEDDLRSSLAGFRQRMECLVDEVLEEGNTRQLYSALLPRRVGDTTLREYYTRADSPTANISHWWHAVRRRVLSAVQQRGSRALFALLQTRAPEGYKPH